VFDESPDRLLQMTDSPVVRANRALALGFRDGPDAGPAALEKVAHDPRLKRSNLVATVRADLLRRVGRPAEAPLWYREALHFSASEPGRAFLRRRIAECGD
jgi:RNA polymerase sigma-70 factor (ECF subfamily)